MLGGLRRNSPQLLDVQADAQRVAQLTLGVQVARLLELDLEVLVLDLGADGAELEELDLAQILVVLSLEVLEHPKALAPSRLHRVLEDLDHDVAGDVLLTFDVLDEFFQITGDHWTAPCASAWYSVRSRIRLARSTLSSVRVWD